MPNTQTPPFVSVSGCTKIIYLPAGIKIYYGLDLSQFTDPVLGAYYAITSDGTDDGTLDSLYVYNGSVFVKILEPTDKNVKLASDYSTLGLTAGKSQEDFNKAVADYKEIVDNNIQGLQTALDDKQDKLSSYDESIIIENGGNIEGNVSLFEEYFEQQNCVLNFTPIQIIGVYVNGIKQRPSSYVITLPKTISVTNFTSGDYIEIQYTKLKI